MERADGAVAPSFTQVMEARCCTIVFFRPRALGLDLANCRTNCSARQCRQRSFAASPPSGPSFDGKRARPRAAPPLFRAVRFEGR
jgi:hypothetical protein